MEWYGSDVDHPQYEQIFILCVCVWCVSAPTLTDVHLLTGQQCYSQSDDQQEGGKPLHKQ